MGCLRLCGVRTAGEATRQQAELSPFRTGPRPQHRIVFNMPSSSIPPDGMISIIKVTVSRGLRPGVFLPNSVPVPVSNAATAAPSAVVQADACTHVRVEISRLAPGGL
jgi:hypothetical protein